MEEVMIKNKIIYYKGRKVGVVTKDGVFLSFRKEKDKFRLFNGWGFSKKVVEFIEKNLPDVWLACVQTEKRILKIPFWEIRKVGIEWTNPDDRKDEQYIVKEEFFKIFSLERKEETERICFLNHENFKYDNCQKPINHLITH